MDGAWNHGTVVLLDKRTHQKNIKLPVNAMQIPTECVANGETINVTMSYNGNTTTLIQKQASRTFTYIYATLEEYGVTSADCNAFNSKVFNFTNMKIKDL